MLKILMTWEEVKQLGATKISRILGCSVSTAHSWISRSDPPEWQQALYIKAVVSHVKKNKAS